MKRFKKHMIVTAAIATLAVIGTVVNSRQAAAEGPPGGLAVNIVGPLPVPVTGNVGVNGTFPVTGSVSISGNSVTNPLVVRDVDNPARHPFAIFAFPFTVPSNERYVIEHYAGECVVNPGTLTNFRLVVEIGGSQSSVVIDSVLPHQIFTSGLWGASANTARESLGRRSPTVAESACRAVGLA